MSRSVGTLGRCDVTPPGDDAVYCCRSVYLLTALTRVLLHYDLRGRPACARFIRTLERAAGDAIMAIDDEPCHSMSTQEVAARLRGPVASRVNVTMYLIAIAVSLSCAAPRPETRYDSNGTWQIPQSTCQRG